MIRCNLNAVSVLFVKPFKGLPADVVEALKAEMPEEVVFIDTPPMAGTLQAIEQVRATVPGVIVSLRDHHATPETQQFVDQLRTSLGDRAVISDRSTHPACSTLVSFGEFAGRKVAIIADPDPDGLTASMKAVGLTYPELDSDAAILDGPRTGQTREGGLSEVAVLLVQSLTTMPPYDATNPAPSERAKTEVFGKFVAASQGDASAKEWLSSKVAEYEEQVRIAKELAPTATEAAPGVIIVDTVGKPRYHLTTLANLLESRPGCRITVTRKGDGPIGKAHGVQYSLARTKAAGDLDLRSYLPEHLKSLKDEEKVPAGCIANTPFLLHVSEKVWVEEVLPRLRG